MGDNEERETNWRLHEYRETIPCPPPVHEPTELELAYAEFVAAGKAAGEAGQRWYADVLAGRDATESDRACRAANRRDTTAWKRWKKAQMSAPAVAEDDEVPL